MKKETFSIISEYDALPIAGTVFTPDGFIKGVLQFSHGMCENRLRYEGVMEFFAQNGYACVIHDHRGHGESVLSSEDFGYFKDTSGTAIVNDLYRVICYSRERFPDKPLTLLGHSMGSLVVRKFIQEHDTSIDRLIVCGSPSKNPMAGVGIFTARVLQLFKGEKYRSHFIEWIATGSGDKRFPDERQKNSWLTRDADIVREYNENPTTGFTFTLNGYINLFHLIKDVYRKSLYQVKNPALPIFFIAGSDDPVIKSPQKWKQAVDFLKDTGYSHVSSKLYADMRHEILNEINKEEVYTDILNWMSDKPET